MFRILLRLDEYLKKNEIDSYANIRKKSVPEHMS